jgi:hypothetical protein
MMKINVKNHVEFARVISGYYRDAPAIIAEARKTLYGTAPPPTTSMM